MALEIYMKVNSKPREISLQATGIDGLVKALNLHDETVPELRELNVRLYVIKGAIVKGLPVNENLKPYFFTGPGYLFGVDDRGEFQSLRPSQVSALVTWLRNLQ